MKLQKTDEDLKYYSKAMDVSDDNLTRSSTSSGKSGL